jgi:predicted esterase
MKGHCILSHGFESGPDATKVTALAEAAERLGWTHERPDYTDLDAKREVSKFGDVLARLQRLQQLAHDASTHGPLVLAGSSLGAWISARVSLEVPLRGLFLMAPPIHMGPAPTLDAATLPIYIIHGWHDELIPAQQVIDWAAPRNARLLLVDDSHRLTDHVQASADAFAALLAGLSA